MKRIGLVASIMTGIAVANLAWVWLQRRDATLNMLRGIEARRHRGGTDFRADSSGGVKITQFYATSGEITDAEHDTICYGVENATAVRIEPPVASLTPSLTRCFWVEPKQDTTYRLIAEGNGGATDSASFQLRVKPAPPSILFMAVSQQEIVKGDAVTVCYGVERAASVRLDPIGMSLPAVKKGCERLYPPGSMKFTLVASGAAGATDRSQFHVKVR